MPRNLHKKATKQQTRMAALNTLGTPSSSRAGSEVEDELDSVSDTSQITAESAASADDATIADDLRRCVDDLGEKRATYVFQFLFNFFENFFSFLLSELNGKSPMRIILNETHAHIEREKRR